MSSTAELRILAPGLETALERDLESAAGRALKGRLARGTHQPHEGDLERDLVALFGIEPPPSGSPPLADVMARFDLGADIEARGWLRADPVNLRADVSRIRLFDIEQAGLGSGEADALLETLNTLFEPSGLPLHRGSHPSRWYLRYDATLPVAGSPARLHGQALEPDATTRRGLGDLARLMTEAQMVLHEHAVNMARVARGAPPVTGIWPWGGGELARPEAPPETVFGDDDRLAALAAHAGAAHVRSAATLAQAIDASTGQLAVFARLSSPDDLAEFERGIFGPAWRALGRGRVSAIELFGTHLHFRLERAARWRVWRRGGSLRALLADDNEDLG